MNLPLEGILRRCVNDLGAIGVRFAVVGGVAISVRHEPRFTRDVDLVLPVASDAEAERVGYHLRTRGYLPAIQIEDETHDRLATLRLIPPGTDPELSRYVDLLFTLTGIEREIIAGAEPVEVFPGLIVPTAKVEHLLAMKVLSCSERRPRDLQDILGLLKTASDEQLDAARTLLRLIIQRGFHRNRDLLARLEEYRKML